MRIWSIHPKYLDAKGLTAVWRETLLAKEVLRGKTKGWKNHPQFDRFKKHLRPIAALNTYLIYIQKEAEKRSYNFDKRKIGKARTKQKIPINRKIIDLEFKQLKAKLKKRDPKKYKELLKIKKLELHPLFRKG